MSNKERGERIRRQILRDVVHHPSDIAKHIGKIFSITPQAVNNHIKKLEREEWLDSTGTGKGKRYFLGDVRSYESVFPLSDDLAEDRVWRTHFSFIFEGLQENIVDICHYGFTEMVNNVIDHSGGTEVFASILRDKENIKIFVLDNGEGIFRRIKRLCGLVDERHALFELSKGKLTTDPDNHTGEGIFFTSRSFDEFEIDSKGLKYSHDDQFEFDFLLDSSIPEVEAGTLVGMVISRSSDRQIQEVFDGYTTDPEEPRFSKTVIPVRLAQYENEKLVSRSQAKRLLVRVEKFQNVILDFEGVSTIGQAFADEIFRVYAFRNPQITLVPVNMEEYVDRMVTKAINASKANEGA